MLLRNIIKPKSLSSIRLNSTSSSLSTIPLNNLDASWFKLNNEERQQVYSSLVEKQKLDWKTLSIDEKRAAYFVSFGPHGPRKPIVEEGYNTKVFLGVLAAIAAAGGIYYTARTYGK